MVAWTDEEDAESMALATALLAPLDEIPLPVRVRRTKSAAPAPDDPIPFAPTSPMQLVAGTAGTNGQTGPSGQGQADARA